MDRDAVKRTTDLDALRGLALALLDENDHLHQRLAELTARLQKAEGTDAASLQQEIDLLKQKLASRERALFAPSSEKRPRDPREPEREPAPRVGHGPTPQPGLPVVHERLSLDEPDMTCPACGGRLLEWKGQTEDSEAITVIEREFHLVKRARQKYRCTCGACVETTPAPLKVVPGGRYDTEFAVCVAVAKYADHLPLERQVTMMARQGLSVTSSTLWDQIEALARVLQPTAAALHAFVLSHPVVGMDETRWPILHNERETWTAWAVTCARAVSHRILESRSAVSAAAVLGDFSGDLMVDGYAVYPLLRKRLDALNAERNTGRVLRLAFCWAHVRRAFFECEAAHPEVADLLLLIGQLYLVEREVKALALPEPEHLAALADARATRSRPVVDRILAWMQAQHPLPRSGLGKAITYTLNLWPGLVRFLHEARIPLDNNGTEREIRPLAVGRKNHYGSKSRRGTEVAALFYSLTESARLNGVDPVRYLNEAALRALNIPGTVTMPWDLPAAPPNQADST